MEKRIKFWDSFFWGKSLQNCILTATLFIISAPVAGIFAGAIVPIFRGMMSRTVGADEQGINLSLLYNVCGYIVRRTWKVQFS